MEVTGDCLDASMKETVCHGRIQKSGYDTAVKQVIVSLQFFSRLEPGGYSAILRIFEREVQRPRVEAAT